MDTKYTASLGVLLLLLFLLPRVLFLDAFQTADEKRWLARVHGFSQNLAHFEWADMYKSQTPGITLQWLGTPTISYSSRTAHKLPVIAGLTFLTLAACYAAYLLWGVKTALVLLLILAINPVLIAHTRVYGTDALLATALLVWLLFLFTWEKTRAPRYLLFSAFAAAFAFLSKLPGILTIPATIVYIAANQPYLTKDWLRRTSTAAGIWLVGFALAAILILPPLATSPLGIFSDMFSLFAKEGYTEEHTGPPTYYLQTLFYFSTPLHMLALLFLFTEWRTLSRHRRQQLLAIGIAALFFFIAMSIGSKKGDRYLLPVFLCLDLVAALIITAVFRQTDKARRLSIKQSLAIAVIAVQAVLLLPLHPHYLAYANPLTKQWLGNRRLGWGEGLEVAAAYLNTKPQAPKLKVATYYPREFQNYFAGEAVDLHQWDTGNVDYAIFYRAGLQRGPDAWETDVYNQLQNLSPEKVIRLNGIDYAWIYKLED